MIKVLKKPDKASPKEGGNLQEIDCFEYLAGKETFGTVRFEDAKPVLMKIFWGLTLYRLIISCRRFGGEDCRHLQGETYRHFANCAVAV
jgi:hypothetical protein